MEHTVTLTTLEATVLECLYKSSEGNGHDFGFSEDAIGTVGKKQLGGVLASLVSKGIISLYEYEVTGIDGKTHHRGHQTEFRYASDDKHVSAKLVRELLDTVKPVESKPAPVSSDDQLYFVTITGPEDYLELVIVEAKASRFARREARAQAKAAGLDTKNLKFSAMRSDEQPE